MRSVAAGLLGMLTLSAPTESLADRRAERLMTAVDRLGDVRPELIEDAVTAAIGVESRLVPAELLLALAWWESRFEPELQNGRVCGVLQVRPVDVGERDYHDACHRWSQDTWQGFKAGADELAIWLRHSRGDMSVALRARACGWSGLKQGCGKGWWVDRVQTTAEKLRKKS